VEGGRPARRNGEAGRDGGETPPLQTHGGETPPPQTHGGETPPLHTHRNGTSPLRDHRGWYTPRKLPHFDAAGLTQAVTFRLADSLPAGIIEARRGEGGAAYRRRIEAALDAGRGSCMLRDPKNAEIVETALRHGAGRYYDLHAYVIMPNHVHASITQREAFRRYHTSVERVVGEANQSADNSFATKRISMQSLLTSSRTRLWPDLSPLPRTGALEVHAGGTRREGLKSAECPGGRASPPALPR
jgi:hypothetical protein